MRRAVKQLIGPIAALAVIAGGLGIVAWSPWESDARDRELAWLRTLSTWLRQADRMDSPACTSSFDRAVGRAPAEHLRPAARIARRACSRAGTAGDWVDVQWRVRSNLIETRFAAADAVEEPQFAVYVRPFAGHVVSVYCWPGDSWDGFNEEWQIFARDELVVAGFADPPRRAAHLGPDVCGPLRRFFSTAYAPYLNEDSLLLSEALVVLAHEGEHVHHPQASEATVQCYAVQDVRELVRRAGRGEGYANEMAGLAWNIAYPFMPASYRTRKCRNGGSLDLHPASRSWP